MSAVLAESLDTYADLEALPEHLTGEIIHGQLYVQPRPAGPHAVAGMSLGSELYGSYHKGRDGPGGWWILLEPEIHFIRDVEVLVPDLAGWRRDHMPRPPHDHRFQIIPDWVCEILSPSTAGKDRGLKMPVYARYQVPWLWLVNPRNRSLEAFALRHGEWVLIGQFQHRDQVRVAPFAEVALDLGALWVDD
jgi:Uma2 family endonuclease